MARRIADRRSGVTGRFTGVATFTPALGGLRYDEQGVLSFGAYRGEATRGGWFALGRAGMAEMRFEDGRLFHALDLSSGRAEVAHECAPDWYLGRYRVRGENCWTLTWQVRGPRKLMSIGTRYTRTAPVP